MQTDITEDQTTPDQVRESFAGIAQGKVRQCDFVILGALADVETSTAIRDGARSEAGISARKYSRVPQERHASCPRDEWYDWTSRLRCSAGLPYLPRSYFRVTHAAACHLSHRERYSTLLLIPLREDSCCQTDDNVECRHEYKEDSGVTGTE